MPTWQAVAVGVIPSIFVLLLFWYVIRAVIRADRNERRELARIEHDDAALAAQAPPQGDAAAARDTPPSAEPKEPPAH